MLLQNSSNNSVAEKTAASIWGFMKPIMSPKSITDATGNPDALRHSLRELCTSAYKLKLRLRECKDEYMFEEPEKGSMQMDENSTSQCVEKSCAQMPPGSDTVAFTLFGALVKYPKESPDTKIILEKSHVVVYR
jgi:hypothetical protein